MSDNPVRSPAQTFIEAYRVKPSRRRQRRPLLPDNTAHVIYQGQRYLSFCSNDYLGLARDTRIITALKAAADRYGSGAGASQLICGYSEVHQQLEQELAEFTGYERTLLFGSGYMANLGALTALIDTETGVHIDRFAHASLIDALMLSRARFKRYAHNDSAALTDQLSKDQHIRKIVVTESVFSMEGDSAPLAAVNKICHAHNALLYLDDAHGFGVVGERGCGSRSAQGLTTDDVPLMMATFGKAFAVSGAFVAGSHDLIECIAQRARSLIYSTAPPPALAAAVSAALKIVAEEQWRRDKLQQLIAYWRAAAIERGLSILRSDSAIQPLVIGDDEDAVALSEALMDRGLLIGAIRPPTVPEGSARLRITLTSAHETSDVDVLLDALSELLPE